MDSLRQTLSEEANKAIRENNIDMDHITNMTNEDIMDLFGNGSGATYTDRHALRKLIKKGQGKDANVPERSPATKSPAQQKESVPLSPTNEHVHTPIVTKQNNVKDTTFTAKDLLQKKTKRGSTTEAQRHFSICMKDAAFTSRIWQKAPCLCEVSATKKTVFFEALEKAIPQIFAEATRTYIWQRLGEMLQNRRKYIRDKSIGKRTGKKNQKMNQSVESTAKLDQTTYTESTDEDSVNEKCLSAGDQVTIVNRLDKKLGTGVFLRQCNPMYAEVVVHNVEMDIEDAVLNELPEPVVNGAGGCAITSFKDLKKKTIIKWKTNLLKSNSSRQKEATADITLPKKTANKTKNRPSDGHEKREETITIANAKEDSRSNEGDKLTKTDARKGTKRLFEMTEPGSSAENKSVKVLKHVQASSAASKGPSSAASKTKTTSIAENESGKKLKHVQESSAASKKSSSAASETKQTLKNVVAMEWGKGEVYLGLLHKKQEKRYVMNCEKPLGRIIKNSKQRYISFEKSKIFQSYDSTDLEFKLNPSDDQPNPNLKFCIWNVPKGLFYVYKETHVQGPKPIFVPKEKICQFWKEFKHQCTEYLSETESDSDDEESISD